MTLNVLTNLTKKEKPEHTNNDEDLQNNGDMTVLPQSNVEAESTKSAESKTELEPDTESQQITFGHRPINKSDTTL